MVWPQKANLRCSACLILLALASPWRNVHAQFGFNIGGFTGGLLPGTPAVAPIGTNIGFGFGGVSTAAPAPVVQQSQVVQQQQLLSTPFGWLFPVYTQTRRDNCVVYEGSGNENLQQVSALFGLSYADVLSDNQGTISSPNEALAGRSVLLCGRNGQRPQQIAGAGTPTPPRRGAPTPVAQPRAPAAAPARPPTRPANAPIAAAAKSLVDPMVQRQALLQLKGFVDPKGNVLKDWTIKLGHCTWIYVTCDTNRNVVRLNMVYLGLQGKLPPGTVMKNLPHLTHIYLGGNELKGNLPADWGKAIRPIELFLNDNLLTGPLPPSWGFMKTLQVLSLPYNQFTGDLPAAWGQLTNLEVLKLNNNKLQGAVPQQWSQMRQITTITLFNNKQMTGCVPEPWSGKGRSGRGYFQSPTGALSDNIVDATYGTSITGFCCKGWRYCV